MRHPLEGIRKVANKIEVALTRYDITSLHEPIRADIETLQQSVAQLSSAFEAAKDSPEWPILNQRFDRKGPAAGMSDRDAWSRCLVRLSYQRSCQ
jgi:hypothetical protein